MVDVQNNTKYSIKSIITIIAFGESPPKIPTLKSGETFGMQAVTEAAMGCPGTPS